MILQVEDMTFGYGKETVFSDISFTLKEGSFTALLGMNGAGKTTLLKCTNGILKPSAGTILLDGISMKEMPGNELARFIGYVPQSIGDNGLTVMDTVLMGRRPHSPWGPRKHDEIMASQILTLLHLNDFSQRTLKTLSGGEAQKVLIGRALAQDPKVLILDEPTSSLDIKNQVELMSILRHLADEHGLTILASIHDINLALKHADTLLMLHKGSIEWCGNPEKLSEKTVSMIYEIKVKIKKIGGRSHVIY
jgi:iron complex transport system ATP-binding protein